MTILRLATFNVENLFARWRFKDHVNPADANKRGWLVDQTRFDELGQEDKAITGAALREVGADVLALQEVENVDTLKHFRARSLGAAYPYVAGVDGNDPRLIDVAVLSRFPITHIRSHQHFLDPSSPTTALFSRDCLEVDVEVGAGDRKKTVTLFVNHFKSMSEGRLKTREKRLQQATKVMELVTERFGRTPGDHPFVVLGDFNDYMETNEEGSPAIADLVGWDQVENVVTRLPSDEQWTHYWAAEEEYRQLDYLLPSASLAAATTTVPEIFRKGLPLRAAKYMGPRLFGVGTDKPKASDHCPVVLEIDVT
ncbi:endonuclease/exonuclease/phosphatase family protein [Streptomyces sp. ME02-8801-2C]|uniref:endonuclease/exonuclease/phosphatase family protein n=1 Tax=Streptomyces sp. ME02-8801-2C TaxID=3028680 RepID=UPI0029A1A6F4|nr:endonuclease/exonuclease/phosphatase family protein [Streptomyces sp. ME02-8801-2C]MDX3454494.1 endonuclease/exonuclease/phosphatase family protein [Streptomyces sp. ME02-8801-2C]